MIGGGLSSGIYESPLTKAGVCAAVGKKFLVCSLFDQRAAVEHANAMGFSHGR